MIANAPSNTEKTPWPLLFGNACLFIFLCMSAIYIFPSGSPQPADFILLIGIIVSFTTFFLKNRSDFDPTFLFAGGFALFTFVINITHFLFHPDTIFIKSSLYYLYNVSAFIFIVSLLRRAPALTWQTLYYGLVISILLELFIVKFFPHLNGSRQTGSFFNPNQLAMWSIFAASILLLLKSYIRLNVFDIFLLLALGYIQTLALSKAGLICFGLLTLGIFILPVISNQKKIILIGLSIIVGVFALYQSSNAENLSWIVENFERVISRLENIGQESDDSLEGRNYDWIFKYPEYLIFGAGEGGYLRFDSGSKGLELHSGIGVVIFSYGIVGSFLFFGLIYRVLRRNSILVFVLIFIVFLNGLTHQNIRFRYFWIFLALCYTYKEMAYALFTPRTLSNGTNDECLATTEHKDP